MVRLNLWAPLREYCNMHCVFSNGALDSRVVFAAMAEALKIKNFEDRPHAARWA